MQKMYSSTKRASIVCVDCHHVANEKFPAYFNYNDKNTKTQLIIDIINAIVINILYIFVCLQRL